MPRLRRREVIIPEAIRNEAFTYPDFKRWMPTYQPITFVLIHGAWADMKPEEINRQEKG